MNSRLSRPLLTVAVSGALVAGSGLVASPALADPGSTPVLPPAVSSLLGEPAAAPATTKDAAGATDLATEPAPATDSTGTTASTPGAVKIAADGADTIAPVGSFTVNSPALWIGQALKLTQGAVTDETSTPDQITRVVNWGDGTTSTLDPNVAEYPHKYGKNGKFTVTVTFQDAAGNSSQATSAVSITTPGKFKVSKTSVWWNEILTVNFSSVPAGTTKIVFDHGDGYVQTLPGKYQTVRAYYYTRKSGGYVKGIVRPKATFHNQYGASSAIQIAKLTVKADGWRPTVKIAKPGSSDRIKSWKTVKGTAADKGSGLNRVAVFATRFNGSKVYCYTAKKTWQRVNVNSDSQINKYCVPHYVKISKGKWSLSLKGVAKGTLYVDASAQDNTGNWSKFATVKGKITRS